MRRAIAFLQCPFFLVGFVLGASVLVPALVVLSVTGKLFSEVGTALAEVVDHVTEWLLMFKQAFENYLDVLLGKGKWVSEK